MARAQQENFAPYAPARAVLDVVHRHRGRGLPDPLTPGALQQIGVAPSMTPPTHQTLRFLQLIDEEGRQQEAFERLRRASTDEYRGVLAEIVRAAYQPVFMVVDPAQDGDIAIADALRRYNPANQREKMVRLFLGLCSEAGIVGPEGRRRAARSAQPPARGQASSGRRPVEAGGAAAVLKGEQGPPPDQPDTGADYRLISAVIQQLPKERVWSPEKRKRWIEAMTAAVDLLVEVQGPLSR